MTIPWPIRMPVSALTVENSFPTLRVASARPAFVFPYNDAMGWARLETRIETLRVRLARDPAAVVEAITKELSAADVRPRYRVRLTALRATGYQHLGQHAAAEKDLRTAMAIPRCGAIARCEAIAQFAAYRLSYSMTTRTEWPKALGAATQAIITARELVSKTRGTTTWSIRQARTRQGLLSATLVIRGQVNLYGYGELQQAFADGIEAAKVAPTYFRRRNSRRHPQIAACSLLAICTTRGGNTADLEVALALVRKIENELPADDKIPRAQVRATLACIKARKGESVEAENLLLDSLAVLRRAGAWTLYNQIHIALVWVVRDCQKRPERADFLAQQHSLEARLSLD
jgi:hypothetical protein